MNSSVFTCLAGGQSPCTQRTRLLVNIRPLKWNCTAIEFVPLAHGRPVPLSARWLGSSDGAAVGSGRHINIKTANHLLMEFVWLEGGGENWKKFKSTSTKSSSQRCKLRKRFNFCKVPLCSLPMWLPAWWLDGYTAAAASVSPKDSGNIRQSTLQQRHNLCQSREGRIIVWCHSWRSVLSI